MIERKEKISRATWAGRISFGLVSIPVKLHTATAAEANVEFRQLNAKTGNPIAQKRIDSVTGDEVEYEDVVKGYEITKGQYIQIEPEELASVAPDKASTIEVISCVDASSVDPIHYDKPYYVEPDGKGTRPYGLFSKALSDAGKVAIGRFVMRSKEYMCIIRPIDGGLSVSTLRWHDEVRDIHDLEISKVNTSEKELIGASALIDALSGEFHIEDFSDEHRARILELIEAKADGQEIIIPEPVVTPETTDLMAALEASVMAAKAKRAS